MRFPQTVTRRFICPGRELATDAHSRASTSFKEYRLITCAASSWRIPRQLDAAFQYTRLQMQIRNNEHLSPIVTRQRRIR